MYLYMLKTNKHTIKESSRRIWNHITITKAFCSGFSSAQFNLLPTTGLLVVDRGFLAAWEAFLQHCVPSLPVLSSSPFLHLFSSWLDGLRVSCPVRGLTAAGSDSQSSRTPRNTCTWSEGRVPVAWPRLSLTSRYPRACWEETSQSGGW